MRFVGVVLTAHSLSGKSQTRTRMNRKLTFWRKEACCQQQMICWSHSLPEPQLLTTYVSISLPNSEYSFALAIQRIYMSLEEHGRPKRATRFEGEDTSPTSTKELNGWYAYSLAAEIYAVVGVGKCKYAVQLWHNVNVECRFIPSGHTWTAGTWERCLVVGQNSTM